MSPTRVILTLLLLLVAGFAYFHKPKNQEAPLPQFVAEQLVNLAPVEQIPIESVKVEEVTALTPTLMPHSDDSKLPKDVNRMTQLFQPYPPVLPIVKTIEYTSRVDWLIGRAAYLGDYASHFKTSKHFISRSLHGMGNYLSDAVSKGDRFNVLDPDKEIEFHLVLDLSRLKLWTYYFDVAADRRGLLKSCHVCAGKLNSATSSGSNTPFGTFMLGNEIAVYNNESLGHRFGEQIKMCTVFGKRWIPLSREIADCSAGCKGLGIHGAPWITNEQTGELMEDRSCIGQYLSSGCIRMVSEDIEEIFSVIVSRPSYIHIVKDFVDAKLPGCEL